MQVAFQQGLVVDLTKNEPLQKGTVPPMQEMKRTRNAIFAVAIITAIVAFIAWRDYSWSERVKNDESLKDLTLVYEQNNHASLERPWTWIKTPVTSLWYVDTGEMARISDEIAVVRTIRISYNYGDSETVASYELVNRFTGENHILRSPPLNIDALSSTNLAQLDWYKHKDGTPGMTIVDFVVSTFEIIPQLK